MATRFGIMSNTLRPELNPAYYRYRYLLGCNRYVKRDVKYCLNLCLQEAGTLTKFTTKGYKEKIQNAVKYIGKPEYVIIENEVTNPLYYTGRAEDYVSMVDIASAVLYDAGIQVTNDGTPMQPLLGLLHEKKGYPELKKHTKKPAMAMAKAILSGIDANSKLKARNIHFYALTVEDVKYFVEICDMVQNWNGIKANVLTTECGTLTNKDIKDGSVVKAMIEGIKSANLTDAVFYAMTGVREGGIGSAGLYGSNATAYSSMVK